MELNHGPRGYESLALPLSYAASPGPERRYSIRNQKPMQPRAALRSTNPVATDDTCRECGKTSNEGRLRKCPICFRHFCDEHVTVMSGRPFCSSGCAQYFFFAEPDE